MEIKIKKFQAQSRFDISKKCRSLNGKIYQHMIKLIYINDINTDHWMNELANYFTNYNSKPKSGNFNYEWYFQDYIDIEDEYLERIMESTFHKEKSELEHEVTELNKDLVITAMDELNRLLVNKHKELNYKRFLNRDEIKECVSNAIQYAHLINS